MNERRFSVWLFSFLAGAVFLFCAAAVLEIHLRACGMVAGSELQGFLFYAVGGISAVFAFRRSGHANRTLLWTSFAACCLSLLTRTFFINLFYENGFFILWLLLNGMFAALPCRFAVNLNGRKSFYAFSAGFASAWLVWYLLPEHILFMFLSSFLLLIVTALFFKDRWYWKMSAVPFVFALILCSFTDIPHQFPDRTEYLSAKTREFAAAAALAETDLSRPEILLYHDSMIPAALFPEGCCNTVLSAKQYDLIILSSRHPCSPKGEKLFSGEGIRTLKEKLAKDGVLCTILPVFRDLSGNDKVLLYGKMLAALKKNFKYTAVFPPPVSLLCASDSGKLTDSWDELACRAEKNCASPDLFPVEPLAMGVVLPMMTDAKLRKEIEIASLSPVQCSFSDMLRRTGKLPLVSMPRFMSLFQHWSAPIAGGVLLIMLLLRYLTAYRVKFRSGIDSFSAGWKMAFLPVCAVTLKGCAVSDPLTVAAVTVLGYVYSCCSLKLPKRLLPVGMMLLAVLFLLLCHESRAEILILAVSGLISGALIPGPERHPSPLLFAAGGLSALLLPGAVFASDALAGTDMLSVFSREPGLIPVLLLFLI